MVPLVRLILTLPRCVSGVEPRRDEVNWGQNGYKMTATKRVTHNDMATLNAPGSSHSLMFAYLFVHLEEGKGRGGLSQHSQQRASNSGSVECEFCSGVHLGIHQWSRVLRVVVPLSELTEILGVAPNKNTIFIHLDVNYCYINKIQKTLDTRQTFSYSHHLVAPPAGESAIGVAQTCFSGSCWVVAPPADITVILVAQTIEACLTNRVEELAGSTSLIEFVGNLSKILLHRWTSHAPHGCDWFPDLLVERSDWVAMQPPLELGGNPITMSRQIKVLDNPIINKIKEGCPNYTDTIGSLVVNPPGCVLSNFYLKYEDKIRDFQRLTPLHRCRPQLSQLRTLHSQSQIMRPDSTSCHDRLSQRRPNVHAQNHPGQRTSEEKKRLFTPVPRLVSSSLEDEEDGRFHRLWKNSQFYDIKNLELEARTWYDVWKNKDYGEIVKLSTPHRKCILSLSQEGSSELYDNSANNMHCGKGLILDRNVRKFSQEGLGYVTSLIVSRPGTTWTQEMVWCINNGLNFNEAKTTSLQKRVPYLELNAVSKQSPDVFECIDQIKSPRLIKTHLPIELLPKEVWTKKPKVEERKKQTPWCNDRVKHAIIKRNKAKKVKDIEEEKQNEGLIAKDEIKWRK
uniref:Sulfotransferase domain-containing protein n=1 Tax=Timema poppense TaxID=170557 RepID=A0A7R9GUQ8_TIMPO|nr:unnamed protein product [Timema poppensis]